MKSSPTSRSSRRPYVVALMLGTLTALGSGTPAAAVETRSHGQAVSDLSRYCTACWRNARLPADCWGDCTQEVLSRLLQRVEPTRWGSILQGESADRQEFVRAIDAVKKRTQRALRRSLQYTGVVQDPRSARNARLAEDREAVRTASIEVLTPRQQHIMQRSFEGYSAQEIAAQLGTSAARVSDEKYKAVRKLREHLCRDGEG